jgi:hypothetical protein
MEKVQVVRVMYLHNFSLIPPNPYMPMKLIMYTGDIYVPRIFE